MTTQNFSPEKVTDANEFYVDTSKTFASNKYM